MNSKINELLEYNLKNVYDYWINYTDYIKINRTHPLIFKDSRLNNGNPYYSCAILWSDVTFSKNIIFKGIIYDTYNKRHDSRMYIREFPFRPKTFKIRIIKNFDLDRYEIIDDDILQDVYNFYDPIGEEWLI